MNIDLIAYARRAPGGRARPSSGERFQSGFGGKGANQAVMARLLGADVSFVGALGDDAYATMTLENFARLGRRCLRRHARARIERRRPDLGGGGRHEPDHRRPRRERPGDPGACGGRGRTVGGLDVVVGQFEIPQAATAAAFGAARARGAVTILNPAPAAPISPDLLAVTDWLIPNEVEFGILAGSGGEALGRGDGGVRGADRVRLVVTLGSRGAALVGRTGVVRAAGRPVDAIDTSGAGDAFVGAFAVGLALGLAELDAVRLGIGCASDSVTRPGTQASFPDADRCAELLAGVRGS